MSAREPGWDYTTFEGTYNKPWYQLPMPGFIVGVKTSMMSSVSFRDEDWENDVFFGRPGELVRRWVIRGDRNGPDLGHTSMEMDSNPVDLVVEVP